METWKEAVEKVVKGPSGPIALPDICHEVQKDEIPDEIRLKGLPPADDYLWLRWCPRIFLSGCEPWSTRSAD